MSIMLCDKRHTALYVSGEYIVIYRPKTNKTGVEKAKCQYRQHQHHPSEAAVRRHQITADPKYNLLPHDNYCKYPKYNLLPHDNYCKYPKYNLLPHDNYYKYPKYILLPHDNYYKYPKYNLLPHDNYYKYPKHSHMKPFRNIQNTSYSHKLQPTAT